MMMKYKSGIKFLKRYIKGYFKQGRFTPASLPRLSIETTNMCDSKCVFCANRYMHRAREHMPMATFKKAVNEFIAMGGLDINFNTTIGDPLLDPYLFERTRYVKKFTQIKSQGFVTTLQWLHKFDMDEFYDAGITWIGISTSLSGREKYLQFFGVDRYEQTLKNILRIIEENKERSNNIALVFSIKPTDEPLEDIINHSDFKLVDSLLGGMLMHTVEDISFYVDDWLGVMKLPPWLKKRPLYPRRFRPCRILYDALMVYSNGKVGACVCRDFEADSDLILGNIQKATLEEIWTGEKLNALRTNWRMQNKIPNICRTCRHYEY